MRDQVAAGGAAMTVRQVVGAALGMIGTLLSSRILGPAAYGVFAGAFRINFVLLSLFQLGANVYIVKSQEDPSHNRRLLGTITWLLLFSALAAVLITVAGAPLLRAWTHSRDMTIATVAMSCLLPVAMLTTVPQALLERSLAFRTIAQIELLSSLSNYLVTVPAAALGLGYRAPILGWAVQNATTATMMHLRAHHRPRFAWSTAELRQAWSFCWNYSISMVIWQARNLAVPVILARYTGTEGVAYVSIAQKIIDALAFPRTVAYRLAISVIAKAKAEKRKLDSLVQHAIVVQVLIVTPLFLIVGALSTTIVGRLFGPQWTQALVVFWPLCAVAIIACAFNLLTSVLYVSNRPGTVNWFNALNATILTLSAPVLTSRFGIKGYAVAELCCIPSYLYLLWAGKKYAALQYPALALGWLTAALGAIAIGNHPLASACLLCAPMLWAQSRKELSYLATLCRKALPTHEHPIQLPLAVASSTATEG